MDELETIVNTAKDFHKRGWLPATAGNLSFKIGENKVLITASGTHKGHLKEEDFVIVDYNGDVIEGSKRPSAETLLHLLIYKNFPQARAVFHVHSPTSTLISRMLKEKVVLKDYELLKAFDGINTHESSIEIRIFDNMQDMKALSNIIQKAINEGALNHGFLLKSHGIYAWGKDTMDAYVKLEALDFLFDCELKEVYLKRSGI